MENETDELQMKQTDFIGKITSTIKKHSMLSGRETVLIGLSGGPDSVCLTRILKKLSNRLNLTLHALYVDHGLRPGETEKEAAFSKNLCDSLEIQFHIRHVDVKAYAKEHGLNRQEAGRLLRYQALEEKAFEIKAGRIAVGHNLDDQTETFLMRILRGSGTKGLSGIPPVRGKIIRPLIEAERAGIEGFLYAEGAGYIVDSSNLKEDYLRNRLRASLIPALRDFNPNIAETVSHTAEVFREEDRYLELIVTKTLMRLISKKTDRLIALFIIPLEITDKVILRRVIRRAVGETKGLRGISFNHIEDIIGLIKHGKAGDRLHLPKGIRVVKHYSTLLMTSEPPLLLGTYELEPGGQAVIKEAGITITASVGARPHREGALPPEQKGKDTALFDADKLSFPLIIRPRAKGDFFYPAGFGRKKKLQDFFVNEKIPRDERDIVPVVTSGSDIIWVAGMREDERFRPTADTKRFLVIELKQPSAGKPAC
ncbi:MAG: tRNA lysidine(34) synthetase TilS [Thermodesulfovibrionales bacterium]|nr:tRNA lysidine(34) synthetase TilS [Thermodesulfovibrionales bacterium]